MAATAFYSEDSEFEDWLFVARPCKDFDSSQTRMATSFEHGSITSLPDMPLPPSPPHSYRSHRSHSMDNMSVDDMGMHGEAWVENPCGFGGSQSFTDDSTEIKSERRRWLRWRRCPKSMSALERHEQKLFSNLKTKTYCTHVSVGDEHRIRTLQTTPPNERIKTSTPIPIVCLHGMGAAIGFWALNIDDIARHRPFFAMDLLGFGNSSRSSFPDDPKEAEQLFVDSIEDWCKQLGLNQFILLGHSFGGYLATAFSMKYPGRIKHLILVDPWGFPRKPNNLEERYNISPVKRAVLKIMLKFSPLAAMRALGPLGPCLMKKVRPDLRLKFLSIVEGDTLYQYIYQCNSKTPASGEYAFMKINDTLGWSKYPLMNRIDDLDSSIKITFIYGEDSWMDHHYVNSLKARRRGKVDIKCVSDAGHHVYADNPSIFNMLVNKACTRTDMEDGRGIEEDMGRK